ncbi:hypothetical protein SMD22_18550 [Brevibacillus halotolerans]|nr:hypothetical protein SMD22_18550 [Brevibacillus halotolerans]
MNLFWKIFKLDGEGAELRIENAPNEICRLIVKKMVTLLPDKDAVKPSRVDRILSGIPAYKSSPVVENTPHEEKQGNSKVAKVKSRPRQLPYVNGTNSLSQNMGEKLKEAAQKQCVAGPGIREIDGLSLYQTGYSCPACKHSGIRYMQESSNFCKCHECKTELRMHHATPEGFPFRDEKGNYFIAEAPWN